MLTLARKQTWQYNLVQCCLDFGLDLVPFCAVFVALCKTLLVSRKGNYCLSYGFWLSLLACFGFHNTLGLRLACCLVFVGRELWHIQQQLHKLMISHLTHVSADSPNFGTTCPAQVKQNWLERKIQQDCSLCGPPDQAEALPAQNCRLLHVSCWIS